MTYASDDLTPMLVPPAREHTGYGQGILREWNPDTFENTVEYRGAELHDLSILDRVGAQTYQAGDPVLLMKWNATGRGLASYWIAGSPLLPAEGAAEEAVSFLRGSLASAIAAEVFAQRVVQDVVPAFEITDSTSFVDLATVGPSVQATVSATGVAIVMIGANVGAVKGSFVGAPNQQYAFMGCEISGATSVSASFTEAHATGAGSSSEDHIEVRNGSTKVLVYPDLNPGLHTFTAKYRAENTANDVQFGDRTLIVIAL